VRAWDIDYSTEVALLPEGGSKNTMVHAQDTVLGQTGTILEGGLKCTGPGRNEVVFCLHPKQVYFIKLLECPSP
jgi:hypothetical protein